eukprot:gene12828-14144_t
MTRKPTGLVSHRLCLIAVISSVFCVCSCEEIDVQGTINFRKEQPIEESPTTTKSNIGKAAGKGNPQAAFEINNKKINNFLSLRSKVAGKDQMDMGLLQVPLMHRNRADDSIKRYHVEDDHQLGHLDERPVVGRCDINKQCKADQYCDGIFCFKCRKDLEHCYANGQCCQGSECQYGYCAKGASAGMPGTYCDKAKDCKGDSCCILEMSVDHHNAICKPMLEEHETCGPINLFHQITEYRAHSEPICGPCKQGLACKSIGIHGHHSVCLPEGGD